MKQAIMVNGNAYKSFNAACQAYNLHHMQVKRLMAKDGIDVENAINILSARKPRTHVFAGRNWTAHEGFDQMSGDFISPDGQHFNSFREMCLFYGQEPSTVTSRLQKMPLDKALSKRGQFKPIVVLNTDGSTSVMSVSELAKQCRNIKSDHQSVDQEKINQLAESGQVISVTSINALMQDSLKAKTSLIYYEGKEYLASELYYKKLAQNSGCNTRTLALFRQKIQQGMSVDEAIVKHAPESRRKKLPPVILKQWNYDEETGLFIAPNGKGYRSRSAMCKDYRQLMSTVTRRLAYGFTLEMALTGEKNQRIYQVDPNANISMLGYYFDKQLWSLDGINFYPNMQAMCHAAHMSVTWWRTGIEHRYSKEYLIAKANLFPIKEVNYHGTIYSVTKLLREHKTAAQTVAYRILKKNCDFETALDSIIASQEKENF